MHFKPKIANILHIFLLHLDKKYVMINIYVPIYACSFFNNAQNSLGEETMKKILSIILSVIILAGAFSMWISAEEDMTFSYNMSVDGKQTKYVEPGDIITVVMYLERTDAKENYIMYGMQSEIRYDGTFFELVLGSWVLGPGISTNADPEKGDIAMTDGRHREFYMNFVSLSGGTAWRSNTLVGTFQLKVKATSGASEITNQDAKVSHKDGRGQYKSTINSVTVIVSSDCEVKFDTNGGSEVSSQSVSIGEKLKAVKDPVKEGYTFEGWYTDNTYTVKWDFNKDLVKKNMTLYAKWSKIPEYKVTFVTNGGSAVDSITVREDGKISAIDDPTKDGYIFKGWYKDSALTKAWDFSKDTVTADTTIYAKWEQIQYFDVVFDSNGGSKVDKITVEKGSKLSNVPNPAKDGYTFKGWYKDSTFKNKWNFNKDTVTSNITLYAKWEKKSTTKEYTVTFVTNSDTQISSIKVASGSKLNAFDDPVKEGYEFGGWYKDEALTQAWDFENDTVTENTTLYAKWDKIIPGYTVNFDTNCDLTVDSVTVKEGQKLESLAVLEREGYTFIGWYKDEALTEAFDIENDVITSDITLYAKWEEIIVVPDEFTVNFETNGGSKVDSVTVESGSKLEHIDHPSKDGYYFAGWYKDEALTEMWDFNTDTVTADTTLYAKWSETPVKLPCGQGETPQDPQTPDGFPWKWLLLIIGILLIFILILIIAFKKKVSFESNGGSSVKPVRVFKNKLVKKPIDPVKEGHTFAGWYKDEYLTEAWDFENDKVEKTMTLYAKWTEI